MIETLLDQLRAKNWKLATAESCTGGLIAAAITDIAGSSDVFGYGFVTYANQAKTDLLGVPANLIAAVGAVSQAVAARMAEGARARAGADIAVAVTGIAGPGGGSAEKPVGTVWFAVSLPEGITHTERQRFDGDRAQVRQQARDHALFLVQQALAG